MGVEVSGSCVNFYVSSMLIRVLSDGRVNMECSVLELGCLLMFYVGIVFDRMGCMIIGEF